MRIAGAPDEAGRVAPGRPGAGEEIRCPSCARLLVLRSGPAVTPHFAHRPRQSCRRRPGRAPVTPLRLEQLTLFDLEPLPPEPVPVFAFVPSGRTPPEPARPAAQPSRRRPRRRAWLPRLVRWVKARTRPTD